MTHMLTTIGFDADDTLWHNEAHFRRTQARFETLLADYAPADALHERLLEAECRNLGHYGFGVKSFVLSMIETAIEVSKGQVPSTVISELMAAGREILTAPTELLPHAETAVRILSQSHRVILITKGDLMHQERKLADSRLGNFFHGVEIVSNKTPETYLRAFARHGSGTGQGMMVGNSLKSDVWPMLEAGGFAVHVPSEITWALEAAEEPTGHPRYRQLSALSGLPALVAGLST